MILIGQFDLPFVRRVGIALRLCGMPFEHNPWSTFGDAAQIARFNPLIRVPTLVLDNGEALIDSSVILDHLDEAAGPDRALIARSGPPRRHALKVISLATGMADKAISLLYERVLHQETSEAWAARCAAQIAAVLDALEADRTARTGNAPIGDLRTGELPTGKLQTGDVQTDDLPTGDFWFGARLGHADIAVACALRFTREAHGALFDDRRSDKQRWPALAAHAARCEALPPFQEIAQPLTPPA